ncbi:lytic transglycosylase domain-containing protein [Microbacterium sp.]|uniref:aggregation-promoting factor C-terminal-like domain-containing protein n=1 Tax=Microbacterium sp. TaxID=51671 RepID=UPI003A849103
MTSNRELTPVQTRAVSRRTTTAAAAPDARWSRRRSVVSVFAAFAAVGLAAAYVGPMSMSSPQAQASELDPVSLYADTIADAQSYVVASETKLELDRTTMTYEIYVTPSPTPTPTQVNSTTSSGSSGSSSSGSSAPAAPFVSPDPGSAQAIAYQMVTARGWGEGEFACLVALWKKESGWRVNAYNPYSGAYGIPQSLPGNKMASAGADWETNPATQITWGLGYISGRYGTPCGAWNHSQAHNWY